MKNYNKRRTNKKTKLFPSEYYVNPNEHATETEMTFVFLCHSTMSSSDRHIVFFRVDQDHPVPQGALIFYRKHVDMTYAPDNCLTKLPDFLQDHLRRLYEDCTRIDPLTSIRFREPKSLLDLWCQLPYAPHPISKPLPPVTSKMLMGSGFKRDARVLKKVFYYHDINNPHYQRVNKLLPTDEVKVRMEVSHEFIVESLRLQTLNAYSHATHYKTKESYYIRQSTTYAQDLHEFLMAHERFVQVDKIKLSWYRKLRRNWIKRMIRGSKVPRTAGSA